MAEGGSPTTLLIRGTDLGKSMSSYLGDRIEAHPNITVRTESECVALHGAGTLTGITVTTASGDLDIDAVGAVLVHRRRPGQRLALRAGGGRRGAGSCAPTARSPPRIWATRGSGQDRTPLPFETSQPGLFAVGDVRSGSVKRVASAVGEGSAAIRSVHEHLSYLPDVSEMNSEKKE